MLGTGQQRYHLHCCKTGVQLRPGFCQVLLAAHLHCTHQKGCCGYYRDVTPSLFPVDPHLLGFADFVTRETVAL